MRCGSVEFSPRLSHLLGVFFFLFPVIPVGLWFPLSVQSRGVVGSVKKKRAKVESFALEPQGTCFSTCFPCDSQEVPSVSEI